MMNGVIVSPLQPYRPLYEDAYNALRDAILNGRLAPGDRIVEAEIARQMAISRAPVREAIRKLERDGLVRYIPRRGTVVVKLAPEEVHDVYYLRAHLEEYAVRLAALRATDDDLSTLANVIEQMKVCAARDDFQGLIAKDVEFHARICHLSGSKRLPLLWDSLNPHSWTLLTGQKTARFTLAQIAERHLPILQALRARDADRAAAAIHRHIAELADDVLAQLNGDSRGEKPGAPL